MPSLRYQMPENLFEASKRNLAQADASVSKFNDTASGVSRLPYATTTTDQTATPPQPGFKFPSIGGAVDTSLGVPPTNAFQQPSLPNGTTNPAPSDSTNWRFRSFGPSQLGNGSTGSMDKAYATNPAAYKQIASPVIPPNYKPKDMSKEQAQYGWGGTQ